MEPHPRDRDDLLVSAERFADAHGELLATMRQLGPDELRVMAVLARRLLVGQERYGRLDVARDPRDWGKERSAEIQDLLIYSAFEELKRASLPLGG